MVVIFSYQKRKNISLFLADVREYLTSVGTRAKEATMNSQHPIDRRRRLLSLLTAALLAVAVVEAAFDRADPAAVPAPAAGSFTDEFVPGGPVYRLPPVHVVADRRTELARIEREERLLRSSEARAKAESKPNS